MSNQVISLKEYKKKVAKRKINKLEKIGLALNVYIPLLLLVLVGEMIIVQSHLYWFAMVIAMLAFGMSLYLGYEAAKKLKEGKYNENYSYFRIYLGIMSAVLILAILICFVSQIPHLDLKSYLIPLFILLFFQTWLIKNFIRKEKHYR